MPDFNRTHDHAVRLATFRWLEEQVRTHGDVLPRELLAQGFQYDGQRVPLVAPQGIFKPAIMELPLSITTSPNGPYDDAFDRDNRRLNYRYRGDDPQHRDNAGLRTCMMEQRPLAYLHGVMPGRYLAVWPVFIVGDRPDALTFSVQVDDPGQLRRTEADELQGADPRSRDLRREYVTTLVERRIHQRAFRERVLAAYQSQCALCRLRHAELLDAAHIIPDSEPEGEPVVSNGLALCRLHHSAFDRFFLGIDTNYVVQVRPDIMNETDGPTLKHVIQGLHGKQISVPRKRADRPDLALLANRYDRFLEVATSPESAP